MTNWLIALLAPVGAFSSGVSAVLFLAIELPVVSGHVVEHLGDVCRTEACVFGAEDGCFVKIPHAGVQLPHVEPPHVGVERGALLD